MTTNEHEDSSFEATYALKMHCQSCVDQIDACLHGVSGIQTTSFDLSKQIMSVTGSAAPSSIVAALRNCGRDAIIRGTGKPNSSAVAVLETAHAAPGESPVRGLVRMVQVADNKTWFDVTVDGVRTPGDFRASVRELGDVSRGAASTGAVWHLFEEPVRCQRAGQHAGLFGGNAFLSGPVSVWQLIGRSMVVAGPGDEPALCGVIARSAGVWENDKQVCACSGKTVWQERQDALGNNMR